MKKLIVLLMTLALCFAAIPALSEGSATSDRYDPNVTMSLPNPGWHVSISCAQAGQTLEKGTTITLTTNITTEQPEYYNPADYNKSYNWEAKAPGGDWFSIDGGETYSFALNADNADWIFRVTVTLTK